MKQHIYEHKVQYYETDQMGVVHHSNYIRWFEEARVDLFQTMGMGYGQMEKMGVISPVLEVHTTYKTMTHFEDTVQIQTKVKSYNGIVLELSYEVKDKETGEIRCIGETKHCFLNREGKLISMKKSYHDFNQMLERI